MIKNKKQNKKWAAEAHLKLIRHRSECAKHLEVKKPQSELLGPGSHAMHSCWWKDQCTDVMIDEITKSAKVESGQLDFFCWIRFTLNPPVLNFLLAAALNPKEESCPCCAMRLPRGTYWPLTFFIWLRLKYFSFPFGIVSSYRASFFFYLRGFHCQT